MELLLSSLAIMGLAFAQNIAFSIVSRSRNRNNKTYHIIAACGSNVIWFLCFRQLILADMSWLLLAPYTVGTVSGSLLGVMIAMKIERWIGASSDAHIHKEPPLNENELKAVRRLMKDERS